MDLLMMLGKVNVTGGKGGQPGFNGIGGPGGKGGLEREADQENYLPEKYFPNGNSGRPGYASLSSG